jgi:triacylglycerol lipase
MQRTAMAMSAVGGIGWLLATWSWSPAGSLMGVAAMMWGHAGVLAVEFGFSAYANKSDPAPRASTLQRVAAWWEEASLTPTIFLWRQPFRWQTWPDNTPPDFGDGTASADPARVGRFAGSATVFVHGFVCNRGFWTPWMEGLRQAGMPYTSVNLEPVFGSIDRYVDVIEDAVARAEALGKQIPVIICHSMGGLAVRAWLASAPGNLSRVTKVITIGSPHHGTWLARWSRVKNGRQMRQKSDWLSALAQKELDLHGAQAYTKFVCWYSNADHIVFPTSTALLPGADNRHVPGVAHVALGFHATVIKESVAMMSPAAISEDARTAS